MAAKLGFRRKVYVFDVERYDKVRDAWDVCGAVILPDYAYRSELAHALLVFDLHMPRPSDQVSWSYRTLPAEEGPLPWPRAWITGLNGTPLVRLSARATKSGSIQREVQ
jgi:hypothetical protein